MSQKVSTYRWNDLQTDHPMERLSRRRVIGERAMISEIVLEEGCYVPVHEHENEQFTCVLKGKLEFELAGGEKTVVEAGQVIHLPPHAPHAARALEDTKVLDVFSPVTVGTGIDQDLHSD